MSSLSASAPKTASDLATLSNPDDVRQKHVSLNLRADFSAQMIVGTAAITFVVVRDGTGEAHLDTFGINVRSVVSNAGTPLPFKLGDKHDVFGTRLTIDIPAESRAVGSEFIAVVAYNTTERGGAIQWLPPEQTDGKVHPFLFTQCQAIHARSFLPCQDTPGAKTTYDAVVTVPKALTAIMSALGNGGPSRPPYPDTEYPFSEEWHSFSFQQPVACASYLIALCVGDLAFKELGDRTGVWAEKGVVDRAAYEFDGMEAMVSAGEEVCGPYVWTRYDVLCMPGSFPYGGMENPCLTFVTPTLLAGDRSLADVVIHEITHSWTGNLVTNSNWKHFWLNEGWTMFVQRKIMSILHGLPVAELDASLRMKGLKEAVEKFGEDHNFTRLCPDLENVDPDDAFSIIPYEKGFHLLRYLETVVGGHEAFKPFVLAYVKEFAFKTLDSDDFKTFFLNFFAGVDATKAIDWDAWFRGTGMPPVKNNFDQSLAVEVVALKDKWVAGGGDGCGSGDIQAWKAMQTMYFIDLLQAESGSGVFKEERVLQRMDGLYNFTKSGNAEIRFRWQILCIGAEMESIIPHALQLATEQGRMKFTRPLYRALFNSKMGKEIAVNTFLENRSKYHSICAKMVGRDLGV